MIADKRENVICFVHVICACCIGCSFNKISVRQTKGIFFQKCEEMSLN